MSTEKKFQLDIFQLMERIDRGETDLWDKLSDEEKKGFSALIIMRWMSGTSDQRQIIYLNEFVNQVVFPFGKHPELLLKLLGVSSSKRPKRYQWYPMVGGKKSKNELTIRVIKEYHQYTTKEAKDVQRLLNKDDITSMAEEMGWQKDEMKLLAKETL
jgi:hypothetical protein